MTPGGMSPAERRECIDHWHWCALHPKQLEDPTLRFTGDILCRPATTKEKAA